MQKEEFTTYHPITNIIFFLGAIILGMFLMHPVYVVISMVMSLAYLFTIKGKKAFKELAYMGILFVLMSVINPIFNRMGVTVLFRYLGRPFTLEALIYGIALGGMLVSILCWFACYNAVMTSDKFIYIFGKMIPSVSLILSMILRLIPNFIKKTKQISQARQCIGMAGNASENKMEKLRNGATVLSTMTSWALEGGIITADSMRARGYGSGKKTNFAIYYFEKRNIILICVMGLLLAGTIFTAVMGGAHAAFIPNIEMTWFGDINMFGGAIAYAFFLFLPTFLNLKEKIKWRVLRSRI
ncbi:MAG: energy-coupling factor transporter transmembrane protein EcfT [Lachnospiraceae bacterium]|nr:energy-coupling factor transporter transmembrane protein EcfT [Lachnospiraceae bacterium]